MKPQVGDAVKGKDKLHGVITEVRADGLTVAWHLKKATALHKAGMSKGTLRASLDGLEPDSPCPHCNDFLDHAK